MTDNEVVPITIAFITMGVVTTMFLLLRYMARRLRSREIIRAIDAGQPVPLEPARRRDFLSDLRTGVLFIAFAFGLGAFLTAVGESEAGRAATALPLFIGLGFLANAWLTRSLGERSGDGGADDEHS